jgi:hypothetical protein
MNARNLFLFSLLVLFLFLPPGFARPQVSALNTKRVIYTDALVLSNRNAVRLIHMDTPKTHVQETLSGDADGGNGIKRIYQYF